MEDVKLYSSLEVAEKLGFTDRHPNPKRAVKAVQHLRRKHHVPAVYIGNVIYFRPEDVDALIRAAVEDRQRRRMDPVVRAKIKKIVAEHPRLNPNNRKL